MRTVDEMTFLLSLVDWHTVTASLVLHLLGYFLSPYLLCRVWKDYDRVKQKASSLCDFNMRPCTALCGVVSIVLVARVFLYEEDIWRLNLVGSTSMGNFAMDIVLGQFLADYVYQTWKLGYPGSKRSILHHLSGIVGSILSHHYCHKFALYRFMHEITLPVVAVFAQMHMVEYDINTTWYKIVAHTNLCMYIVFRMLVIPFHWAWFAYVIYSSQSEWSDVWFVAWPIILLCHAAIDYVNFSWGCQLIQIHRQVSKLWKHQ